jgi:hypothetical protein
MSSKATIDLTPSSDDEVVFLRNTKSVSAATRQLHDLMPEEVQLLVPRNEVIEIIDCDQCCDDESSNNKNTDLAIAKALAVQERCSQHSRKRQRSRPFHCRVCLEEGLEGWKGYCLVMCQHRFCVSCLQGLVESSSTDVGVQSSTRISCPQVECKETLTNSDIRYIFRDDPAAWHSYSTSASMAMLEREIASGGARRCPQERCNYTFFYEPGGDGGEGTLFVCPDCESIFCLGCKANGGNVGPAHDGSCTQRMQQLEQEAEERRKLDEWKRDNAQADARFEELIQKEVGQGLTKPCPKCKALVTKNGGCNHMSCRCGHSYNWS